VSVCNVSFLPRRRLSHTHTHTHAFLFVMNVQRCMSSKELGTLAPPSGSPYANMLAKKEELETSMRIRLQTMRESLVDDSRRPPSAFVDVLDESSSSSRRKEGANESRNRRRAAHNQAVVNDLCDVVADLFIAESKLLKPMAYGVSDHSSSQFQLVQVVKSIHNFVSALPTRYALGADTPSEVLLHMRLMAAARADSNKAVVHIHNLEGDTTNWSRTVVASGQTHNRLLRLVTIACNDVVGLLEYITKLLATGGSRVLDADVMLSTDGIVLVRFCCIFGFFRWSCSFPCSFPIAVFTGSLCGRNEWKASA
jgi:hypothetical protein